MNLPRGRTLPLVAVSLTLLAVQPAQGQIDPYERRLLHVGYNQPVEGRSPLALYAFYLHNQTNFIREDWTLRAAIAPVWVDAQLGWKGLLGENTDLGLIAAGGGFARTYNEIRLGDWEEGESFYGHGFTVGAAGYHLFNPTHRLPLQGIIALTTEGTYYSTTGDTDDRFELPPNNTSPVVRCGLRLGGQEPDLRSPFAFEVSAWYEGRWRTSDGAYGFDGDRELREFPQLFWGRLLGRYSTESLRHDVEFSLTSGTGSRMDRLAAFRMGGMLPFASEFPLSIPGYYHQELSAQSFVLLSGNYSFALTSDGAWRLAVFGATSSMNFIDGLDYPSRSHSGIGGGIGWRAPRRDWIVTAFYGYGFDAVREDSTGGHMVGLVLQYDFRLEGGWDRFLSVPRLSHGLLRLFGR